MAYKRVMLTERDNNITQSVQKSVSTESGNIRKQLDKFDTSYTSKKLNELYNEFDSITFNSPSLTAETIIKENVMVSTKNAISFRTTLYLSGAAVITLLLLFLAIYNIFVINALNGGIKILQEDVSQATLTYNSLYAENSTLNNYDSILQGVNQLGFSETASGTVITLPPLTKQEVETVITNSNWFDAFCNFVAGVFGG